MDEAWRHTTVYNSLGAFYAEHPTLVKALGAGAQAPIMSHISNRR
jgi:hypothetical protein